MAVAVSLSPIAVMQFFDNTGKPAVGGTLLTQVGGVNYPTYSDVNGTVALPNPIPLNSRGECSTSAGSSSSVFVQQGVSYTFTLSDKDGNQLWSLGNIAANNLTIPFASTSGTNTITAVFSPALTSLFDGLTVEIKIANTTTGTATFNPNGLGSSNLYYSDGTTQILAGALIQNNTYQLIYNSSLNSSAGGWEVINPSRVTGSFTATLATGLTTTPTGTINYAISLDSKWAEAWCATGFTGTSNAASMTVTGVPSVIQIIRTACTLACAWTDSGALLSGAVTMGAASGTWTARGGGTWSASGFTSSGAKGFNANFTIGYPLD